MTGTNGTSGGTRGSSDGLVIGTASGDLMLPGYVDGNGDRIDGNDAILPGMFGNDDLIIAGGGNDSVNAGLGNDLVYGGAGKDTLLGGEGNDTIYGDSNYSGSGTTGTGGTGGSSGTGGSGGTNAGYNDLIYGGDGNDLIVAGGGDDSVDAGLGNDLVYGGAGKDTLLGGEGNDTIYGDSNHSGSGTNGSGGSSGGSGGSNGSGGSTNAGYDDLIYGGDGNDLVYAEGGNDTVYGGNGNDLAYGGSGNDVINTSGGGTVPLPDLGYPNLYPADSNPINDLDTVDGGSGNDTITTGDDADLIFGGTGNDSIDGGFDKDTIFGGSGSDTIIGGEGSDVIDAGAGSDLIYGGLGPSFPDSINIPDDDGDLVPNNGRDSILGGAGNDTIYGLDDDDTIDGGTGNDLINSGVDDDSVTGGTGNDTITGGQGADTLSGGDDRDVFLGGNAGDAVSGGAGGDDYDILDLQGVGPFRLTGVTTDSDGNGIDGTVEFLDGDGNVSGTMVFTNMEEVVPCFTPGTLIATPRGEVPVEMLREGDRIITRDNGIQEIRWVGQKSLNWHELNANPYMKPILVRQGSLGHGLPERDMMVSPNHRLLVANDRTALYFDEHEVLVAAKHLVPTAGIQAVDSLGTTYIHFMFDRHEVVLSNGAWTESFQPGDYTLKGMGNAQRSEIMELFPELRTEAGIESYASARRTLKRHEAILLVK